jgi:amino acid adenylation domain-containing protein
MSDMMKRLAKLPAAKRNEILALLLADDEGAPAGPTPRAPGVRTPLSYAQETLWFLDRMAPGRQTYNVPLCFRLTGPLDVPALRRALDAVVRRHEALRSALAEDDDGPVQVVAAELPVELELREVPADQVEAEVAKLAAVPFDLRRAPLWRMYLLRSDDLEHHLFVNVHHAVFDGWSLGVFGEELAALYAAERDGVDPALPDLPVQYADYALWQRDWLRGDQLDQLGAFWRERLAGAATLEFPTDRPRPAEVTYAGQLCRRVLPLACHPQLRELARQLRSTPFTVYLAAFFALLHRYTGQDDLVIGSPTANREQPEVERLIGFFVNMLVLRVDAGGDPTLRELAERLRPVVQEAYAHGALPFDKLVEAVGPVRDPARSPLFQVAFTFQNAGGDLALPGVDTERILVDPGASRFEMSWNLIERGDELDLNVEFNTDLFDAATIEALIDDYVAMVTAIAAAPETRLSQVPLLDDAERDALLHRHDGPRRPVEETTVAELFARRVAAAPDALALVVGEQELTYAELDRRANQLAHLLVEAGARPDALVALCLPRGVDLVVSMLATLKAGAAYLPLDPTHPPARLAGILADAAPVATLTVAETAGNLPDDLPTLLRLDESRERLAAAPPTAPPCPATPESLAYVIYTSGSTGTPKGVLIEQRNLVNFVASVRELFDLTPADRVLGFASHTFDVSVFETFAALLVGARLHLARAEERLDLDRLQGLLERAGITVVDLPPSVMALLDPDRLPRLRIVFVGGEAFGGDLVNRWNPGRRFFNGYGPTECTVTMIVQECPGTWTGSPPIGLPMANHVAHVLDRSGALVPYGVAGELVIGGAGLARGYLNRPELTAEKFIPDPFGTAPDGRLYRTGDLVKRYRDGSLQFLGRIDQQVKIRGLRIELGEIEALLDRLPQVTQSVVQPWTDEQGEKHLVGYVTATGEVDPAEIRAVLAEQLPPYMVPAHLVALTELPLTSSGKVDRAALPAPQAPTGVTREPVAWVDEVERVLGEEIVAPVLHRPSVDPRDNFFEIGGHSLAAAQVVSRVRRHFSVEVGLADFFRAPTVRALADLVRSRRAAVPDEDELLRMLEAMTDEEAARLLAADGDPR